MLERFNTAQGVLRRILLALILLAMTGSALAEEEYLPPDAAFQFSARMVDAKTIVVHFKIADGYYMYRERFAFKLEGATLGEPLLPDGKIKYDETFKKNVETYRHDLDIRLPVDAVGNFSLSVSSQGCADRGLCYAPMESVITLSGKSKSGLLGAIEDARNDLQAGDGNNMRSSGQPAANVAPAVDDPVDADSEMGRIESVLKGGKLLRILPWFLLLGLGLAFTPCVLPMLPILSALIVGEGRDVSRRHSFLLSVVYSLGMALVYTALGIAAGLIGRGLSADLQHPLVLSVFAVLMVGLSLAMFGVYHLQMPAAIQHKLMNLSHKQSAGELLGVFIMGALSALIVGPCVAAPLAGVLVYISQTRDVVIGGSALFAMAVGMSIPLLLLGLSAGSLLPRAGAWMEQVKRFFGVLMLAMAWWIVSPLLPAWLQMTGWAVLAAGYGFYLLRLPRTGWMAKGAGGIFIVFALLQLTGVVTGAQDPWAPLAKIRGGAIKHSEFKRIKSLSELDAAVAQAKGKTVMLDFYADWCISCKEMENLTFADAHIQAQFADMVLLQADVTANSADDKALLKRFNLFGPPGIIFFDKDGREMPSARVIGYQNADRFAASLERAKR